MAKKPRRRREQLKRSKPHLCGVREFSGDLPCEKPAGHPGGHLAIHRRSAEQILADELRQLRLALSKPPGGLVAKAERAGWVRKAQPSTKRRGRRPGFTDEEFLKYQPKRPLSDGELAIYLSEKLNRHVSEDQIWNKRTKLGIPATPSAK